MARVLVVVPDLLLGSRLLAALGGAGHDVRLASGAQQAREGAADAEIAVVDLAGDGLDGVALLEDLRAGGLGSRPVLGFYAHVDVDTRRRAEAAGFDQVVPRSRIAREGADLVERLLGSG